MAFWRLKRNGPQQYAPRAARAEAEPLGFSEAALRSLEEMEARRPPPEACERSEDRGRPPGGSRGASGRPGGDRPHYWGHRERLRQRFMASGTGALPDYELLELILFNAIGRIDVKPLAKTLLAEFGDFNGVVGAPEARLLKVEGVTPKVLVQFRLATEIAGRMARAKVLNRSVVSSWSDLIDYCRTVMAHRDTEQFRVLYLDRKNVVIADESQGQGSVDHVPVYPREVAKRALELNASALILVHNHPSGDPTPSQPDIDMTERVEIACEAIGVTIHDHVIIGKDDQEASFRSLGLF